MPAGGSDRTLAIKMQFPLIRIEIRFPTVLEFVLGVSVNGMPRWLRIVLLVLIYGGLLALGQWGSGWMIDLIGMELGAGTRSYDLYVMTVGVVLYAALLAIPFVPGIEISLALFAVFGSKVALAIYAATVTALAISWLIGRMLPVGLIAKLFGSMGLQRAKELVLKLEPLSAVQRLDVLFEHAPKRVVPHLLKHRYIAVIVALNVPGNAIIGGGGGIALLAGMSGVFSFSRFLASVCLAALPLPLFVVLIGL